MCAPLRVCVAVYADFPTYTGGVYVQTSTEYLGGHAIKIIGACPWGNAALSVCRSAGVCVVGCSALWSIELCCMCRLVSAQAGVSWTTLTTGSSPTRGTPTGAWTGAWPLPVQGVTPDCPTCSLLSVLSVNALLNSFFYIRRGTDECGIEDGFVAALPQ